MNFLRTKRGMALITVLLLTVLLVLISVSMIFITTEHLALVGNLEAKEKALKAAEAGIEYAMYKLNQDPTWGLEAGTLDIEPDGSVSFFRDDEPLDDITVPYTSDCTFNITFDSMSKYRSVNNLFFNPHPDNLNHPDYLDTPPYTAKIISVGKCGSAVKIVEASLVRNDFCPYAINTQSKLEFGPSRYTVIRGKGDESPGYVYSKFFSDDPNGHSIASGDTTAIITYKGTFMAKDTIDIDPDVFCDATKMDNLPIDYTLPDIEISKILERAGSGSLGTVETVDAGNIISIGDKSAPPPTVCPVTGTVISPPPGITVLSVTVPTVPSELAGAAIIEGPNTIKLTKDLYIPGPGPEAGDEDKNLDQLYNPNTSYVASNAFVISVNPSCLVEEIKESRKIKIKGKEEIVEVTTQKARDLKLDLNGHNIYSNSHVILAIDTVGSGKIVSGGKIAFSKGLENNGLVCISGDDLVIEVSDRVTYTSTQGFLYSEDDIKFRPVSNDSVLRMGGQEVRIVKEFDVGTILYENDNMYDTNNIYVGTPAAPDPAATSYGTYTGFGPGFGFLASTYSPYTPHGMKVRRVEKSKGYYELILEGYNTSTGGETVESSITVTIPSAYACGSPPKTQIDFGPCRIKITPDPSIPPPPGSLSVACRVDILDSEGKVMDPGARATVLSHVGMTEAAFQLFGRQVLYTFNNNMAKANIIMEGTVVSKNRHNSFDLTEDRCYFDAGDQFKGYINVGWSPDYMASMVYIEGINFKVHKVSSREIR